MPTPPRHEARALLLGLCCLLAAAAAFVVVHLMLGSSESASSGSLPATSQAPQALPSAPPASSARKPFTFVGAWVSHTASLQIRADHTFTIETVDYVWSCPASSTCAAKTPGATANGTLTDISGSRASGRVTDTNKQDEVPTGPVVMRYDRTHDAITVDGIGNFCGPNATAGWCGA